MEENKEIPQDTGKLKIKKLPKYNEEQENIKLDLTATSNQQDPGDEHVEKVVEESKEVVEEVVEQTIEEKVEEAPILEEIIEEVTEEQVKQEEKVTEELVEAKIENEEKGTPLPENLQKVVDFMEETGGDIEDYVKLNQDYKKLDDSYVLKEYYKQTKNHLSDEEINFLIEDTFSYDEEENTDREIKRKKLAFKEQVANARTHMDGLKSSYYAEIKAGSKLTSDQKNAINFYEEYNKTSGETQKVQKQQKEVFNAKTESLFNNEFKGFEYKVGEKTYRYNVKDAGKVKSTQSDINNFVKKFLNDKNEMSDAKGYHKSLYTAMNADAVAQHFYEQGKSDAIKNSVSNAKNVDMSPRQSFSNEKTGFKYKVLGDNTTGFKLKQK